VSSWESRTNILTIGDVGGPAVAGRRLGPLRQFCVHVDNGLWCGNIDTIGASTRGHEGIDRNDNPQWYCPQAFPELLEAIAAMYPDAPVAPQLIGRVAALRERSNVPVFRLEREEHERRLANVRAKYLGAEFDRAFAVGRGLTRDHATQSTLALQQSS
jgi:hypothetical protein